MTEMTLSDRMKEVGSMAAEAVNGALIYDCGPPLTLPQILRIQTEMTEMVTAAGLPTRPTEVEHAFADGIYRRTYPMPAGQLAVTKTHKKQHFIVCCGDATIWTEAGQKRVVGFHCFLTEPGTKRVIYAHADTLFMTFQASTEHDLDKLEATLTGPDDIFEEIDR